VNDPDVIEKIVNDRELIDGRITDEFRTSILLPSLDITDDDELNDDGISISNLSSLNDEQDSTIIPSDSETQYTSSSSSSSPTITKSIDTLKDNDKVKSESKKNDFSSSISLK
jgi:hypothetical protein